LKHPVTSCIVFIFLGGHAPAVPAGLLRYDAGTDRYLFQYGRRYLASPKAEPVDAAHLPLAPRTYVLEPDRLGSIRDAAPDYWGRLVMEKTSGRSDMSEIDFLLFPNAERIGNLDFRKTPTEPGPGCEPPAFADLSKLLKAAEAIESGVKLSAEQESYLPLLCQGSSLGGARPKSVVNLDGKLWLAKFPSRNDRFCNARVEMATMQLASHCGINIPKMRLERIAGRDIVLIERFDRTDDGKKLGYMSALSLLDAGESEFQRFSYTELADRMRTFDMQKDLQQLFKRICFNVLCRNTDDHPRNHGFVFQGGKASLSPAFDVTPTPSIKGISETAYLSMSIGQYGKEATGENLLSQTMKFGVSSDQAEAIFSSMRDIVSHQWEDIFVRYGVSKTDTELFSYTFTKWLNHETESNDCSLTPRCC